MAHSSADGRRLAAALTRLLSSDPRSDGDSATVIAARRPRVDHGAAHVYPAAARRPVQRSRISVAYARRWRHARRATQHRPAIAGFALPAFRAGSSLGRRLQRRRDTMARLIDRVAQPLALCAPSGRILHRNPALSQVAAGDGQTQVMDAIDRVARMLAASGSAARRRDPVASSTSVATGRWRVVGRRLERQCAGATAILVSLLPSVPDAGSCEELRASHGLTRREVEVVRLLRLRRSNAEIASALGISEHTARHHTENVLLKLGLHSRTRVDDRVTLRHAAGEAETPVGLA